MWSKNTAVATILNLQQHEIYSRARFQKDHAYCDIGPDPRNPRLKGFVHGKFDGKVFKLWPKNASNIEQKVEIGQHTFLTRRMATDKT